MSFPYVASTTNVTVVLPDGPRAIRSDHPNFAEVVRAVKLGAETDPAWFDRKMAPIAEIARALQHTATSLNGRVSVVNDTVCYDGTPVYSYLADKILDVLDAGYTAAPWVNFLERVMENPSRVAVEELFLFLEGAEIALTPDGYFLAYKRVNNNYTDVRTGAFDNSPGRTVRMANRNQVDDDRRNLCSYGLHVCSWNYLPFYAPGRKVVMVKVDPADVVAVPADYDNAKMRVVGYEVLADVTDKANEGPLSLGTIVNGSGEDWDAVYDEYVDDDEETYDDLDRYEHDITDDETEEDEVCGCGDSDCTWGVAEEFSEPIPATSSNNRLGWVFRIIN